MNLILSKLKCQVQIFLLNIKKWKILQIQMNADNKTWYKNRDNSVRGKITNEPWIKNIEW